MPPPSPGSAWPPGSAMAPPCSSGRAARTWPDRARRRSPARTPAPPRSPAPAPGAATPARRRQRRRRPPLPAPARCRSPRWRAASPAQDRQPIPISGGTTKQLTLPDAWLAIPYQPALVQGQPLVIANQSGGDYAISLLGSDFGEVRLDGGLVVPGRYYRINGAATITSTVPVGVHVRPLTAVGTYYDQPLLLPSADG